MKTDNLDDVALANYFAGVSPGPVDGGKLSPELSSALGVLPGTRILLSDYNLTKIRIKHQDIGFRELCQLPLILAQGFVIRGERRRSIESCYFNPAGTYLVAAKVALKATHAGEVYLTTFHRLSVPELRRMHRRAVKRGALIRDLKSELARQLTAPAS
jgi:hypothetical protein